MKKALILVFVNIYVQFLNKIKLDDGVHHVKLYCKCKIPDDGRKMWACDGRCNNWYHPECLNFTAEEAEKIGKLEFWICPDCQPSTVIVNIYIYILSI